MMTMKLGKRVHRIAISLDDETYLTLSHLANYERKDLSTYVGHRVEELVHGVKMKLPADCGSGNESRSDTE